MSQTTPYQCPFNITHDWAELLREELESPYMWELVEFVKEERQKGPVFPKKELVFRALNLTPLEEVKVVIMGQDPYHGPGQAMGLSFSVPRGMKKPPSVQNIFKEQATDLGTPIPEHGDLEPWARQGVLMLNATLTVRQGEPKSHYGRGWERLTDAMVAKLWARQDPIVFLLWGNSAKEKCLRVMPNVESSPHLVLSSAHPSPFSAYNGFFGSRHFSQANQFLKDSGREPINWEIS